VISSNVSSCSQGITIESGTQIISGGQRGISSWLHVGAMLGPMVILGGVGGGVPAGRAVFGVGSRVGSSVLKGIVGIEVGLRVGVKVGVPEGTSVGAREGASVAIQMPCAIFKSKRERIERS